MPTWPTTLPQEPRIDSSFETPPNLLSRTEMDAGPAKIRKRFTSGARKFEAGYHFTPEMMTAWEDFYENYISDGALSFTYPHPRKWGTFIEVRLTEPPQYKHLGAGCYDVGLKLEKIPGPEDSLWGN